MLFVVFFVGLLLIAAIVLGSYVFIHFLLPIFIGILALASLCAYFGIGTKLEWAIYDRIPQLKFLLIVLAFTAVIIFVAGFFQDKTKVDGSATEITESSSEEYWEDRAYKVPEAPSSWVEVSEEFYIGPDAELTYNNKRFINFSDVAVRGVDAAAPADIRTDEADRGFRLIVMDDDTVYAQAYNNTNEDIIPLGVQVQSWDGDYEAPIVEGDEGVIITGYKDAPDGFGFLVMYFSNGESLALGVYKQDKKLYAFNILPLN